MPRPPHRIATLRGLAEHRRPWMFAQLERGNGLSARRAQRQSDIVRRHILGNESRASLCREFGISQQQFYADRRDGVQRALEMLEASAVRTEFQPDSVPTALVANATALYEAGATLRAQEILEALPDAPPRGLTWLEARVLALEIGVDLDCDISGLELARCGSFRAQAGATELPFVDAAIAWAETYHAAKTGDSKRFRVACDRTVAALRCCETIEPRAAFVRARCLSTLGPSLLGFGFTEVARSVIEEAARVVQARADMPVAVRALMHANRACIFAASLDTLPRARGERETAFALAIANALPRTIWVCLYLSVIDNIWRGDGPAALSDARRLLASVEAGDSQPWRRIACSRLSNAYSALHLVDDAERAIAPLQNVGRTEIGFDLQMCVLTYRRANYTQAIAQATRIIPACADRSPSYHANALLYSAASAYRLNDVARAAAEISDAVSIFEASSTPALFIAHRTYSLAHTITGRTQFRAAAHELQTAFDAIDATGEPAKTAAHLTPRQREIARLAAGGATNQAIAVTLGISARTVGNHLATVFSTLGLRARWQLPDRIADP